MTVVLDKDKKIFMVYILGLIELPIRSIYFFYIVQVMIIIGTKIFVKYYNFSNISFLYSATKLQKYIRINNHPINLYNNKQILYRIIYC